MRSWRVPIAKYLWAQGSFALVFTRLHTSVFCPGFVALDPSLYPSQGHLAQALKDELVARQWATRLSAASSAYPGRSRRKNQLHGRPRGRRRRPEPDSLDVPRPTVNPWEPCT